MYTKIKFFSLKFKFVIIFPRSRLLLLNCFACYKYGHVPRNFYSCKTKIYVIGSAPLTLQRKCQFKYCIPFIHSSALTFILKTTMIMPITHLFTYNFIPEKDEFRKLYPDEPNILTIFLYSVGSGT